MTAVIYARYSSDSQREASIEGQLRDCKDYAEKNGITVVGTYIDRAYSAKTDDRPNHPEMSFPWNNTITWLLYGLYVLVTVVLLIAPKMKK
ncbi:hypothetical protein GKE11_09285 [Faecalibacterium prausnitzii]|nr:hypothetical protein [Faecalibacterium prausnitzii]